MLVILLFAVLIVGAAALAVAASGKPPTVVERHHHHATVIERPAAVSAQIFLIQAEIRLAEAKMAPAPVRLPVARLLTNPKTAIERYRSHGRSST